MELIENNIYHIYNQGSQKLKIFYDDTDYNHFLNLIEQFIYPKCDIVAYNIMPSHFHFIISANEKSVYEKRIGNIISNELSNGLRMLQSSYTQYRNHKSNKHGSLFKQKTKCKCIFNGLDTNYFKDCFIYVHQNPFKDGLVNDLMHWKHSSFLEYCKETDRSFINFNIAMSVLDIKFEDIAALLKV